MKSAELQNYIQTQIVQAPKRLEGMVNDMFEQPLFKRNIFTALQKYALDFIGKRSEPRIIVMPGLRGTGKTTLLAQLFLALPVINITKFYLSVEEAMNRFDCLRGKAQVNLWDIFDAYEVVIGKHLEEFSAPLLLFFDEIHYDEKWTLFLKTIYDRSKNVMVFCTGSAALLLREQMNADVARRAFFVNIDPISFTEYMLLKHKKAAPQAEVSQTIKEALFFAASAADAIAKLQAGAARQVQEYWLDIDAFEINRYLKCGTFPFTLAIENEVMAVSFIAQIINKVIYTDIPQFYPFSLETLNRIDRILYLISGTSVVSATKLGKTLEMKGDTLRLILQALESAGLVNKISPYGAPFKQAKKASKYLFATPALRFSYFSAQESVGVFENYKGSLLEDLVGMYVQRVLRELNGASVTYDAAEGGADFVIAFGKQQIVMEVGMGKKSYRQIINSVAKIAPRYSVIVSQDELEYKEASNAIKVPLKYFLLL